MSLNNLRNYNWEQGTLSNPVSLTGTQFDWLINLLKNGTVIKDIRGYIQVGSPITSYEKYLVELAKDENNQPLLHLVNPTVTPVEYTVVPQASTIKEGTSTKLNINGIGLEALKFRIVNHTNTTPDYQARTTIDTESGYVRVAPAQENTTWTDIVTIQACPIWEEWTDQEASIVDFDITVNAVAVTSVTITAPQYVKPGITFNPIVNFLPVGHTKPLVNTLEDAAAKRGICFIPTSDDFSVGKTTDPTKMSAVAPNTETPAGETWSLGCGVYAFTNAQTIATPSVNVAVKYPYIQFTVTTDGTFSDISSANPKITLRKVDSEDEPIGQPIVLTGTVSGSSLVYTYGNGNVAGDGSETYRVSIEKIRGYNLPTINDVIPNQVVTRINAAYLVITPDIYLIYTDGTEQNYDSVMQNDVIQGKTPICIKVITADGEIYIEPIGPVQRKYASSDNFNISSVSANETDYLGVINTQRIENALIASGLDVSDPDVYTIAYARSKRITIADVTMIGYIPSAAEAIALVSNNSKIDAIKGIAFNNYDTVAPVEQTTSTNYSNDGNNGWFGVANTGGKRGAGKTDVSYFNVLYTQI